MADYVTPQGLNIPSVSEIISELETQQRADIDPNLNTSPDSPIGQLNGIFSAHLRRAYEVLQIAYNGNNPDAAEGFLLEAVSAITGTTRAPAKRSRFVGIRKLRITLALNTTVPEGTTFHVDGDTSVSFHTTEEIPGTAAGDYYVAAECDTIGPVACNAGTLTQISTPVSGLSAVTNDYDAELGALEDNDPQLRERREQELRTTGSGTVDSLRSDILAVALEDGSKPIQEADVLENYTMVTDVNGLPPKSLECLVYDGVSQDCPDDTIAQVIWDGKPGGIELVGSTSGTAIDSKGVERTVPFTRFTLLEVVLEATLTLTNPNQVPSQYLAAVQEAVLAEFKRRVRTGTVIRCNHYEAAILDIAGIEDVSVRLGFNPPGTLQPAGTNLTLAVREMGYIQSSGVTVV